MKDIKFIAKQVFNNLNIRRVKSEVHQRQTELAKIYVADPEKAIIIDKAASIGVNLFDPYRTEVLIIDPSVPVGFTSMHIAMEVGARNISEKLVNTLVNATKRSCVVYQTLKNGITITKELKIVSDESA